MAQTSLLNHSPLHRKVSPDISVTNYDDDGSTTESSDRNASRRSTLVPPSIDQKGNLSESDRYYTASSGEDYDDDDEGLCIRLDSDDDDNQSLSGMRINLKTLQAVSSMLAHYNPIIQSDAVGNPMFVAPPPPPEDEYTSEEEPPETATTSASCSSSHRKQETHRQVSSQSTTTGDDDYHCAIQELEDVLFAQDKTLFSDAMTELTDVMEKMTKFPDETSNKD